MFLMIRIEPRVEEVGIAGSATDIFWRSGSFAGDAAGIFRTFLAGDALQAQQMTPIIAKIVFVEDREGVFLGIVGKVKVDHPDLSRLEGAAVGQTVLIGLRGSVDKAANIELMQMAVGPAKGRLQHLVELGKVESDWQRECG